MSARTRRRRAFVLFALALACGGLAASEVSDRVSEVEGEVGAPVPVVVAARDIAPSSALRRADLAVRHIPQRYAPRDAPSSPDQAVGLHTAGPIAAGSPITAGVVRDAVARRGSDGLRRGERAVDVAVTGAAAFADGAYPGARVDVLVSTDASSGVGRTFIALEDVELLALGPGGEMDDGSGPDGLGTGIRTSAIATLRVTLRQAVYLTAAQNFARELRLLARPTGDRQRVGRATVDVESL